MNKIIITSWFIGSQQTQHIALHNDDLDHVGQLTRPKHGGTKRREYQLVKVLVWAPRGG